MMAYLFLYTSFQMRRLTFRQNAGHLPAFTLIELLLVIGIIAVLAAIVIIAINPQRMLIKTQDIKRTNNAKQIQNALNQYFIDKGTYDQAQQIPVGSGSKLDICKIGVIDRTNCISIDAIVPQYITSFLSDPYEDCTSTVSGYTLYRDANNHFFVDPKDLGQQAKNVCDPLPADYALSFPTTYGSDGYVDLGSSFSPDGWSGISISAWIYSGTTAQQFIVSKAFPSTSKKLLLYLNSNYVIAQFGGLPYDTGSPISANVWHHIVATADQTKTKIYIDGTRRMSVNTRIDLSTSTSAWKIGNEPRNNFPFLGKLDNVAIFSRALFDADVQALWNSGYGLFAGLPAQNSHTLLPTAEAAIQPALLHAPYDNGLEAAYNFNEGAGTTVKDFSGNARTGTLMNNASWINGMAANASQSPN